ncbi:MAG: glycine cleavage system protein T, partial [Alphaproteobacteria bacterium]
MADTTDLKSTPLRALHEELGARMVPFAGYAMPVQYRTGIIAEHLHTRSAAGLFDVSHMGQITIRARQKGEDPARVLERLVPSRLVTLAPGRMRYTVLLNDDGGIIDDLIVTRTDAPDGALFAVVNAARKEV